MEKTKKKIEIIKADLGWKVVEFVEEPDELFYQPIIAWAIDITGYDPDYVHTSKDIYTNPVLLDNDIDHQMMQQPDGTFIDVWGTRYNTAKEVIKHFQDKRDIRIKRQKLEEE